MQGSFGRWEGVTYAVSRTPSTRRAGGQGTKRHEPPGSSDRDAERVWVEKSGRLLGDRAHRAPGAIYFASPSSLAMRSGENVPWPSRWRTCLKTLFHLPDSSAVSVVTVILPFMRPNAAASSSRIFLVRAAPATAPVS